MRRSTGGLLFLAVVSCILVFGRLSHLGTPAQDTQILRPRQILPTATTPTPTPTPPTSPSPSPPPQSPASSASSTIAEKSTSDAASLPSLTIPATSTSTSTTPTPGPSSFFTTDAQGQTQTIVVTATPDGSASASPSQTSQAAGSNSGGLGMGSIIGMSVAGAITVICIVGFIIWKFTRKRFSDFDDNEAIKWPELNAHGGDSHPLPVNNTGRAGFETSPEASVEGRGGYAASTATASTAELNPVGGDPYAVPPLPHLNPNQPYRDDPNAYYDSYHNPLPNPYHDGTSADGHMHGGWAPEAIPMTQMAPGRSRSPGPQLSYDMGMAGRQSPGPQAGRMSPGPQAGRMSPGPQAGRMSPGPNAALGYAPAAYGAGPPGVMERTVSPGPAQAYGMPPAAGRQSPGPYAAYGAR